MMTKSPPKQAELKKGGRYLIDESGHETLIECTEQPELAARKLLPKKKSKTAKIDKGE